MTDNRSLFDAPQGINYPKTFFVPTLTAHRRAEAGSRRREAPPLAGCLDAAEHGGKPRASGSITRTALRVVLKLLQRVFIAEALLWLTALACALAGFPAIVTAFCVALVGFIANCWLAILTFRPIVGRLIRGRS